MIAAAFFRQRCHSSTTDRFSVGVAVVLLLHLIQTDRDAPSTVARAQEPEFSFIGNLCGDNYDDARFCDRPEPCPMGENSECSPGRLCFQVETCAEADPIYDDSFCGEHYLDAQTNCNARCPRGKDLECPEGNKCFSVEECLSDPVPLPPQRPWGAPRPSMSAAPERAMAAAAPEPAPPPSPSESPNSSGPSAAMLIGITAAILVAIIAIFAVVALYIWRRRSMRRGSQRNQDQQDPEMPSSSSPPPSLAKPLTVPAATTMYDIESASHSGFLSRPPVQLASQRVHSTVELNSTSTFSTAASGTNASGGTATAPWQPAPGPHTPHHERMAFMHHQLNLFGERSLFLREYVMLGDGPLKRFQGGQAIVQIVRERMSTQEFAAKFFMSRSAFEAEAQLYLHESPLKQFMPHVRAMHDNADKQLVDLRGVPLPPCIVMEKGESLDIFCDRSKPDQAQAYSVVLHIARRVADLHAAGYAHRDLKPSNTMWLARENKWTLIDFGCAARIGTDAPLIYSLGYAPPEVVAADRAGVKAIPVTAALDCWAVGVVVMELFAGRCIFSMSRGKEEVMAQIVGEGGRQLPWEEEPQRGELLWRLGALKRHTMALLDRDPARRPSMRAFVNACERVLASTTKSTANRTTASSQPTGSTFGPGV